VGALLRHDDAETDFFKEVVKTMSSRRERTGTKPKVSDRWLSESRKSFAYFIEKDPSNNEFTKENEEEDEKEKPKKDSCSNEYCTCGADCTCGPDCKCGVPKKEEKACSNEYCKCGADCTCGSECECGVPAKVKELIEDDWVVVDERDVLEKIKKEDVEVVKQTRKKKKKKRKGPKKPPFCLYGNRNVRCSNDSNFMRSHNVIPDRYPNKPQFPQSFRGAGKGAKVVGGGGALPEELAEKSPLSATSKSSRSRRRRPKTTAAIVKTDVVEMEDVVLDETVPKIPVVVLDATTTAATSTKEEEKIKLPPAEDLNKDGIADSNQVDSWEPKYHPELDPRNFAGLPPKWTKKIRPAGTKVIRGESVADVLYMFD